jgi:hypothetical protein
MAVSRFLSQLASSNLSSPKDFSLSAKRNGAGLQVKVRNPTARVFRPTTIGQQYNFFPSPLLQPDEQYEG